jgi:hypothetical protein
VKKTVAKTLPTIRDIARITIISGFTLTPLVSSSKNLRSPAPWAGMRAPSLRFFLRTLMAVQFIQVHEVLIKVMHVVSGAVWVQFGLFCFFFVWFNKA